MCGKIVLSKKGINTMRRTYLALSDEDRHYLITLVKYLVVFINLIQRIQEIKNHIGLKWK